MIDHRTTAPAGRRGRRRLLVAGTAAAVLATVAPAPPAAAIGGDAVTGSAFAFVAKVTVGTGDAARACTGALVAPQWIATARECFPGDGQLTLGAPPTATSAIVGRTDLTSTAGVESPVVYVVPHPVRDVVLAKLATPVPGVAPVPVATSAPAAGDVLSAAGFGRTATEWVPNRLHAASFAVSAVDEATLTMAGTTGGATICRGDSGGPTVRTTASGVELVALHHRSWQGGCLGETETRRDAVETRLDTLAGWIRQTVADVTVYGALADGRLTASAIDSATGDRLVTVTSTAALGFAPKALATLNATTLLATNSAGVLYRVDLTATNPALTFAAPVQIGTGWTHDLLSYDGDGSLFGIAAGTLRRYTVTSAKPAAANIINNTAIGTGFALRTLTSTGPDWILGTTAAGAVRSYHIDAAGVWTGYTLVASGWGHTHLVSPGNGLYYGRTSGGGLQRYLDAAPFDGKGTDIQSYAGDPVDTAGWDQSVLSALPLRAFPQNAADVVAYGVDAADHLTYTAAATTGSLKARTVSAAALPFAPKAMATLNFDTVLVTSTAGVLYRLDVTSTVPTLAFAAPVQIGTGWTHDLLSYDGAGSLFGIAAGTLRRYTVTSAKPAAANLTGNTVVGTGFALKTLTTTGPDWILGTTAAGAVRSYHIDAAGAWTGYTLATAGWGAYAQVVSPGAGLYYAVLGSGAVSQFRDAAPFDGDGSDIQNPSSGQPGWTTKLLSAQPFIA